MYIIILLWCTNLCYINHLSFSLTLTLPPSLPLSLSPSLSPSLPLTPLSHLSLSPFSLLPSLSSCCQYSKTCGEPINQESRFSYSKSPIVSTIAHPSHCSMPFSLSRPVHSPKTSGMIRTSLVMLKYQEVTQRHPRVCLLIYILYFLCALLLCLCVTFKLIILNNNF